MATLKVPITSEDHIQGSLDAPVTLLEYGDYECPYCAAAYPILNAVKRHFGDDLCFVFRHFPLTQIHPNAQAAAETAEYAGAHGMFWEMHDSLYDNSDRLSLALMIAMAGALGLSEAALRDALASGQFTPKVQRDFLSGVRSGVNGTPTFFINNERHDGSWAFDDLVTALAMRLETGGARAPTSPRHQPTARR